MYGYAEEASVVLTLQKKPIVYHFHHCQNVLYIVICPNLFLSSKGVQEVC